MGTQDPVRAVFCSALHVDRSFLCCCAISFSDRSRIGRFSKTNHGGDCGRRDLFSLVSVTVCFFATTRSWLARCALRLVSRNGCAVQSASITSRGVHVNPLRHLFSSHAQFHSRRDYDLVRSDRVVPSSHVSASLGRYCRRLCLSGILLLSVS